MVHFPFASHIITIIFVSSFALLFVGQCLIYDLIRFVGASKRDVDDILSTSLFSEDSIGDWIPLPPPEFLVTHWNSILSHRVISGF